MTSWSEDKGKKTLDSDLGYSELIHYLFPFFTLVVGALGNKSSDQLLNLSNILLPFGEIIIKYTIILYKSKIKE